MDTTISVALNIIANPSVSAWRKAYWIDELRQEIDACKIAGLYNRARQLEIEIDEAIASSAVQQETFSRVC